MAKTTKVTFTLDEPTLQRLGEASERLNVSKSEVVREAILDYYERIGRLSERERVNLLRAFDEFVPHIRRRPAEEVQKELKEIRATRRKGGRRTRQPV
jgi:hypothetical protein